MSVDLTMSIPEGSAAPEETSLPAHFPKRNNLAGDVKLVDDVRKYLQNQLEVYKVQDARDQFVTKTGGTMDTADRAWRVALRRNTSSSQHQNTLSDTASSVYHRAVRALTAGENAIFFQGDTLPARYEADLNTEDYTPADGTEQARLRNLTRDYTWERDIRRLKIKAGNMFKNKNGQHLWEHGWAYQKEKRMVKVRDPKSGKIERVEREVIVKEWPTLIERHLRNFYADAYIDDIQQQIATMYYSERGWDELASLQRSGEIMNLKNVSEGHAATGETDALLENQRTNAGETPEVRQTGLLSTWDCWALLSIQEFKRKGRGKLDRSVAPEWYWCTFVGGSHDSLAGAVCVRLIKNPYNHKKLPYFMDYAYHDDKGLYHVAPINLVESAYWQAVTNINQAIDNVTLRNRRPYTIDGPVMTRDMTFIANKVIKLGKGTTLTPIEVPRSTEITMEMYRALEDEILKALGITQTIEGVPLGGRTSASEAENDLDQAMKPLMQKADENGQAFYEWLMWMDAELWDQFARPELELVITHMQGPMQVAPAEIYGPIKVKVTAVTEFESRATRRRELNGFLQSGGYQLAAEIMPPEAKSLFWQQFGREFGFRRVRELFPPTGDLDALRRAASESMNMLHEGAFVAAQEGENHSAHLSRHEPYLMEYQFLPEAEIDPEAERRLQLHIEQHKQFQADVSQRQAPSLQEGTTGELNANPLEAAAGAQANLG